MTTQSTLTTLGEIRFSQCGEHPHPLFRVNADVPISDALEHASALLHLAKHSPWRRPWSPGATAMLGRHTTWQRWARH